MVVELSRMLPFKRAKNKPRTNKETRQSSTKSCPFFEFVRKQLTSVLNLQWDRPDLWEDEWIHEMDNSWHELMSKYFHLNRQWNQHSRKNFPHCKYFSKLCEMLWWRLSVTMLPFTVDKMTFSQWNLHNLPNTSVPYLHLTMTLFCTYQLH